MTAMTVGSKQATHPTKDRPFLCSIQSERDKNMCICVCVCVSRARGGARNDDDDDDDDDRDAVAQTRSKKGSAIGRSIRRGPASEKPTSPTRKGKRMNDRRARASR